MKGRAEAHGAISVVNAIAAGKGGALGVGLRVEAEVEVLEERGGIEVNIEGGRAKPHDRRLAEVIVGGLLKKHHIEDFHAVVKTRSQIPIAKGLKSSSASANAIVLASSSALGEELGDLEAVNLGVNFSLQAGVTITGAFDDACASYFGGLVLTDNLRREILKRERVDEDLEVVIYVPEPRLEKRDVDKNLLSKFKLEAEEVFKTALEGRVWQALTLNGLLYSAALGFSAEPAVKAISAGALASGLSGTGPSVAAVCLRETADRVQAVLSELPGEVIRARVNNRRARVI